MSADPLANPLVSSPDSAVYDVLTQAQLLSIITSFQNGLPGATAPLVIRYLTTATGHFAFKLNFADALHKWGEPSTGRILTPLGQFLYSKQIGRERVTAEAVAKYDTEDLATLRFQLVKCASERRPDKARRRCVHNAWGSAAAFGRVDMLAWLTENHGSVVASLPLLDRYAAQRALKYGHASVLAWLHDVRGVSIADDPVLAHSAVARAVQYGHVAVLDWLEATFGASFFTGLLSVKPIVQRNQRDALRWMFKRGLGMVPTGAVACALERRDIELLRELLAFGLSPLLPTTHFGQRQCVSLINYAVHHQLWDVIVCLVGHNFAFMITLLDDAIKRRDFEVVQCLLDHLPNAVTDYSFPTTSITCHLVKTDDVRVLGLLETADIGAVRHKLDPSILMWSLNASLSEAAVRLLMRMSPTGDIAMLLMQHAIRHEVDRLETMLSLSDRVLPPPVIAFVERVTHQTLGPVASLADVCVIRNNDAHLMESIVYRIPYADRDDARDTVLRLLLKREYPGPDIRSILDADASRADGASCDEDFLELCLSLRHCAFDKIAHGPIANYLALRKRRETQETAHSV